MSISITDVRSSRRNAMQNIRRGFNASGEIFSQSPELFPTGEGYSPSQLEALFDYYEQFRGHRITPDEMYDIGSFIKPAPTEDEWYDDYEYSIGDTEDTYNGSFIQEAIDRVDAIGSDYASPKFRDFISMAKDYIGENNLERFFEQNQSVMDSFVKEIKYIEEQREEFGDHSTNYLISQAFERLNDSFFSWTSNNIER